MSPLLFLAQRIPFPPNKGEKIRHYHILQHLRRSYDVYLGCLIDEPIDREHVPTVRALCRDAYIGEIDRRRAKLTCLSGLLTGEPLSVTFYRHGGLRAWVRRVLREVRPVACVVCSSNMAPYILDRIPPRCTTLVDLADVDSEKWRAYAERGSTAARWVYRREWRHLAELEARILKACDWSTFVSAEEAALFERLQPGHGTKVRAISNGVDHGYFDPARSAAAPFPASGADFVFTGTMDYPPNVEAVTWFTEAMLPLIRQRVPSARFYIVGANPAPAVARLAEVEGVTVTGRVPETRPYIGHADVCVAPLRVARGIQNKVLEAMAMARPVVATTAALEGIAAAPGAEVILADTPADFAQACIDALGPAAEAIGQAARRRVVADYSWPERMRGFDRLLQPAMQELRADAEFPG